ncbi:L-serine ammonia-lyase [Bartonella sp. HY329]|uniref:L-serine ammonia-lyase n=1 Tax=unclassified Bartonella TaxID=2645622 RepID=UPI0021C6B71E|nr:MULTISPECIES: L-serine ammonia-lyase [unclassified Bartonella]UXM94969.1 L-serine ammonia-lyase [Bartonella sp. HY329]UXN09292.1 L-serine ammonia-lyase [Bartonella sp. HY328]
MFLSIFEIFKIGIGPSSSHTMGPMSAASLFLSTLRNYRTNKNIYSISATLYGSLAFTGKGHASDRAIALGLLGFLPATLNADEAEASLLALEQQRQIKPFGLPKIKFDPQQDIIFDYGPPLAGHANGMIFRCFDEHKTELLQETYYSIGGGFVLTAAQLENQKHNIEPNSDATVFPYPFKNAVEMLRMARESGLSIAQMKRENELCRRSLKDFDDGIEQLWAVMNNCIDNGLEHDGELPGGLHVKRRAKKIYQQLVTEKQRNLMQPHAATDWLIVYAMAVNEENAAGGRVVTAPTNGAAGVVPAVLRYYLDHCHGATKEKIADFLLTAAAIGGLIKHNASISGAEAGCQGEVGSASSMAAAGLCAALGGTPMQIENAAEIALEHHLGMTCDPVAGLVQVPCIERNGLGATKAVAAASLALRGDGTHFMPLDNCIEAMRQTGEDMNLKFKETSQGGLAVNVPEC